MLRFRLLLIASSVICAIVVSTTVVVIGSSSFSSAFKQYSPPSSSSSASSLLLQSKCRMPLLQSKEAPYHTVCTPSTSTSSLFAYMVPPLPTGATIMTTGRRRRSSDNNIDNDTANVIPTTIEIECYFDLTCPFSAKMFRTLYHDVIPYHKNDSTNPLLITIKMHHVIQLWHPQSTMVHEVALAVKKVLGIDRYLLCIDRIYNAFMGDNKKFTDADTWNKSRLDIYDELLAVLCYGEFGDEQKEILSPDEEKKVKALLVPPPPSPITTKSDGGANQGNGITQDIKWVCKHHRTRGVHVTPTVFVNGIEATQISSGWNLEEWNDFFKCVSLCE